ncbi:hypothetical protein GCM10027343_03430 [Noviherbaspirillum agri]
MEFSHLIPLVLLVGGAVLVLLIPVEFILAYDQWIRKTVGSRAIFAYMVAFFAGGFILAKNLVTPVTEGHSINTGILALSLLMGIGAFSVIWFWWRVYRKH